MGPVGKGGTRSDEGKGDVIDGNEITRTHAHRAT